MKLEMDHGATKVYARVQAGGGEVDHRTRVSVGQASRDLSVHGSVLRRWVQECAVDPQLAFPGQGQMRPEQGEIERLRREVFKLKAERGRRLERHS